MAIKVQRLIEGKEELVCITRSAPVTDALAIMINHDYSQLPVVTEDNGAQKPDGMVTHEGILRGIRNFKAGLDALKVKDVMVSAPVFHADDDLFDILDSLKKHNAVLVVDSDGQSLVGIITSYDSTQYFRDRTEDMMRVEDIESTIKEFIEWAYCNSDGTGRHEEFRQAIAAVSVHQNRKPGNMDVFAEFDELTLNEYIGLLIYKKTWSFFEPIFCIPREALIELLNRVRLIRNSLAHFRVELTNEERDSLKFSADWISKRMEEFQGMLDRDDEAREKTSQLFHGVDIITPSILDKDDSVGAAGEPGNSTEIVNFSTSDPTSEGSRYDLLADWLQDQPGSVDRVPMSFNKVEEIIQSDLPPSARERRVWWANDSVGHTHSQLWLEAGWRTTYINLSEGKVVFARVQEREKAYIAFFSRLLDELRKNKEFPCKDVSPDGVSWIIVQTIPQASTALGSFAFAFTRGKRMRVELYLDLYDQGQTKVAFDRLIEQKALFEAQLGPIEWERLDHRRASRLAIYHDGYILEEKGHPELIRWAAETMTKFYKVVAEPAEKVITEVTQA